MPKLYEYFGIIVLFHSNEHDPIHVHGRYQNRESKAEIVVQDSQNNVTEATKYVTVEYL